MSAGSAVAQLGGEVGQVLAHARLERRGLGAHGLRRALQHLLAPSAAAPARAPIRSSQLGHRQLQRAPVDRQALADERREPASRRRARCRAAAAAARAPTVAPRCRDERLQPRPARSPASARFADTGKIAGSGTIAARCWRAKRQRLGQLGLVEQVGLGDHEDQPVARRAQDALLEELPLGRGQDLRRVEQEHRRVGARQVAVGDVGALLVDVVDARACRRWSAGSRSSGDGWRDLDVVERRRLRRRPRALPALLRSDRCQPSTVSQSPSARARRSAPLAAFDAPASRPRARRA